MWLTFVDTDPAGRPLYDVYVDQGSGFFFVGTFFL
jgi:hypothetical protein